MADDFVTMREAQAILGISKFTMWRLVRDGKLTAYQSEIDRREKLIRRADLDALRQPKPLPIGQPRKSRRLNEPGGDRQASSASGQDTGETGSS